MSITWKNALKQQPYGTVAFSSLISQIKKLRHRLRSKSYKQQMAGTVFLVLNLLALEQ